MKRTKTDDLLDEWLPSLRIWADSCQFKRHQDCLGPWTHTVATSDYTWRACDHCARRAVTHQKSLGRDPQIDIRGLLESPPWPTCPVFWGSHGCDLPLYHDVLHTCLNFDADDNPAVCNSVDFDSPELFV